MTVRFFLTCAFFLCTPLLKAADPGHATPQGEAFIENIGNQVITLLTDKTIHTAERAFAFHEIFTTKFNVKSIGKFVLGRYWKQASPEEREKFLKLFTETVVLTYATRFQDYTSQQFRVVGSRSESDGGVTIISELTPETGNPIRVDWKLFEKEGKFLIYDVFLDGISMGITQRSEYSSVIQQGGGRLDVLLSSLEDKVSSFQASLEKEEKI